ncbi:hypothetical protein NL676_028211 [Syzygium grande]|nr:hypothetical protein NL676_028211 [Syzygium grande]
MNNEYGKKADEEGRLANPSKKSWHVQRRLHRIFHKHRPTSSESRKNNIRFDLQIDLDLSRSLIRAACFSTMLFTLCSEDAAAAAPSSATKLAIKL